MQGADNKALEDMIKKHYGDQEGDAEDIGVKGMMDLATFINKAGSECLNEDDDHPYGHCLTSGGGFLQSDCDEQLILSLSFNQGVKVHSLKVKGPKDKGPKTVSELICIDNVINSNIKPIQLRIFQNQPNTLDFDKADSMEAAQDVEITEKHLSGDIILLKFVKFQNVTNLQFFFKVHKSYASILADSNSHLQDNQSGDDVTQIDHLCIIGTPIDTTNMKDFKRVSGKKGESE